MSVGQEYDRADFSFTSVTSRSGTRSLPGQRKQSGEISWENTPSTALESPPVVMGYMGKMLKVTGDGDWNNLVYWKLPQPMAGS